MRNLAGLAGVIPVKNPSKMTSENSAMRTETSNDIRWYALRDLKRPNALQPAYKQLADENIEVFTPMKWKLSTKGGRSERRLVPVMQDLLFAHSSLSLIEPIMRKIRTLQFRFDRGGVS